MLQVAGYLLAMAIGFSLGLIGGGGSILTIPVLVFFFNIDPLAATTYSLFIVGMTAISGSFHHYQMKNIDLKTVLAFGIPSVLVLFIMRRWLVPMIPPVIAEGEGWELTKSMFIMIIFCVLMLFAGWSMIRKQVVPSIERQSLARLMLQGAITGAITGFIGIGGGFIIVPSLVLFAGLPMKRAIGTSLTIISVNCLVGILGNWKFTASLNYYFLFAFTCFAIAGIILGTWAIKYTPDRRLKPIFGWIILTMSVIVFIRIFMQHY